MFSKKGSRLLEEPTAESSYGSISIPGSSIEKLMNKTQTPVLSSSAPAVLEPSKYASRPLEPSNQETLEGSDAPPIDPWEKLETCSCPESSSFTIPIISDDQTINLADGQQTPDEQEMHVPSATSCILIYFYKNIVIKLRSSFFIHIFQLLFSSIQLSAIVMAVLFDGKCNGYELLPAFGGVVGVVGLTFTGLWMSISCNHRLGQCTSITHSMLCGAMFVMFFISVTIDASVFGVMAYNYDEETTNCSKTFYDYALYKQIATGVSAILAALLYYPGSLLYLNYLCG